MRLSPDAGITAQALISRITQMTTDRAKLIINTYRADASIRILELFGRRFDYRHRRHLESLLAPRIFVRFNWRGRATFTTSRFTSAIRLRGKTWCWCERRV